MLKLLIADDEVLVRHGLRMMIDWPAYGFEVVGEAGDGEKALALAMETKPDIVLTDLLMPKMDGLSLIRALKRQLSRTKVVVLSCHNDYELVREAMQMWGAVDYLFKLSMQPKDILDVLLKVKEVILQEQSEEEEKEAYRWMAERNGLLEYSRALQRLMALSVNEPTSGRLLPEPPRILAVWVLADGRGYSMEEERRVIDCMRQAGAGLGITPQLFSFSQEEMGLVATLPGTVKATGLVEAVSARLNAAGINAFCGFCQEQANRIPVAELYASAHAQAMAYAVPEAACSVEVQRVLSFLRANHMQSLRLTDVAEHVHMNESYLSSLLKKSMGAGFSDLLNQIRLKEAKRLMQDMSLSMSAIADRVGYSSWSYFSRVFKKTFHMTPAEYRRRITPKSENTQK